MKTQYIKVIKYFGIGSLNLIIIFLLISGYYYLKAKKYYSTHPFQFIGDSLIIEDPVIGYSQKPNIAMTHTRPPVYTVFSDDRGTRVNSRGVTAQEKVDILAIGGSFTWGHGLNSEDTFIQIIGKKLNVTVTNAALASYGTTAALLSLKKSKDTEPDIVIYGFITDHINRSFSPCAPSLSPFCRPVAFVSFDDSGKPYIHPPLFGFSDHTNYFKNIILDHAFGIKDVIWAIRRDLMPMTGQGKEQVTSQYPPPKSFEQRLAGMKYLMDEMVKTCSTIDAALVVVYIPHPYPYPLKPPPDELIRVSEIYSESDKFVFVNMTQSFENYMMIHGAESLRLSKTDSHLNAMANRLIAEKIITMINTKQLIK